jgi:hypothetical protein
MKSIIKSILIVGLFCTSSFVQSMEKTIIEKHKEFLAQQKEPSNFMRWVNKNLGKYVLPDYPSKPATPIHQEMWKKAQNDLNIPEQYHAPIVLSDSKKNNLRNSDNTIIEALMSYKMYVNEESHNPIGFPFSRYILYHEAAHHKYLDAFKEWQRNLFFNVSNAVLTSCSTIGFSLFSLYIYSKINNQEISLLQKFPLAASLTSCIITFPLSVLLSKYTVAPFINNNLKKLGQFIERRADLEAAYTIKCDQCVQVVANNRKNLGSPTDQELLAEKGYLSWQEFEAIAQEHKKNGNVCDYHKNGE